MNCVLGPGFAVSLAVSLCGQAAAQEAPFYQGKTLRLVISTGVAGGYAEYARVLADHLGRHLAGAPRIIVQSMPGAGGLNATNYLYAQAPADGTTIGMVHSTIPLAPLWGNKGVRFDTLKFNWLATLDRVEGTCVTYGARVKTWDDLLARESTVGSTGAGSQMDAYPTLLNKLFGTKIKVIGGYKTGTDIYLAMERGEIDGRCGGLLMGIKFLHPNWIAERKISVPIVMSDRRLPEFPDSPAVMEFVRDERTRAQLDLALIAQTLDRPLLAPPGVPPERVKELRGALDATFADAAFRADIAKHQLELKPTRGEEMTQALGRAFAFPPAVIEAARETMGGR